MTELELKVSGKTAWIEFGNGDRMFLNQISLPEESIHVVYSRKGAKRNAVSKVLTLSQAKTTKKEYWN